MTQVTRIVALTLLALLFPAAALAHSGPLDSYGCHRSTPDTEYHCHDGPFTGQTFPSEASFLDTLKDFPNVPLANTEQNKSFRITGKVVRVLDGDSFMVYDKYIEIRVSLYGIMAPETEQPGGLAAKEYLSNLLIGQKVVLDVLYMDKYGRHFAIVFFRDGKVLQEKILDAGFAWLYPQYCQIPICHDWAGLEKSARNQKLGIWSESGKEPFPPWKWRSRMQ